MIIAIQWASLAGGDHENSFFNRTHAALYTFRRNLRTMFEFKGETYNSVKFSCLLCLSKKNVSPFVNSLPNLRQHVKVRTESYTLLSFFILLYYTGRTLHNYVSRQGVRLPIWCDITRTVENVVFLMSWIVLRIVYLVLHLVNYSKSWECW